MGHLCPEITGFKYKSDNNLKNCLQCISSNLLECPNIFSQLIQGMIDGEEEFVKAMKMFITHKLNHLDCSHRVPINVLNQKEIIFRNIKDIVGLHER